MINHSIFKSTKQKVGFIFLAISILALVAWVLYTPLEQSLAVNAEALTSPEIYNSAFSPTGTVGGEIIPASCSLGYPWHAGEPGPDPCNPTLTLYNLGGTPPLTPSGGNYAVTVTGGGSVSFGYTSNYAAYCEVVTAMSEPGLGYNMYYQEEPTRNYNSLGPIANKNGWIEYKITCRQLGDITSAANVEKKLLITTQVAPKVAVSFTEPPPIVIINSFVGTNTGDTSGQLSWSVSGGATSCSATGASGGWSGFSPSPISGIRNVNYPTLRDSKTYSYTLTCTNGITSDLKSTTISFDGVDPYLR